MKRTAFSRPLQNMPSAPPSFCGRGGEERRMVARLPSLCCCEWFLFVYCLQCVANLFRKKAPPTLSVDEGWRLDSNPRSSRTCVPTHASLQTFSGWDTCRWCGIAPSRLHQERFVKRRVMFVTTAACLARSLESGMESETSLNRRAIVKMTSRFSV